MLSIRMRLAMANAQGTTSAPGVKRLLTALARRRSESALGCPVWAFMNAKFVT
jgi:hypothetical protein